MAADKIDYFPEGHSWSKQLVLDPVPDHLPTPQLLHPFIADVAVSNVDL